jgi:hypothetical protein
MRAMTFAACVPSPAAALLLFIAALGTGGCREAPSPSSQAMAAATGEQVVPASPRAPRRRLERLDVDPFIDELQRRTFRWFSDTANPVNGLVPDRWPTPSFSSVAAVGFGLTAVPIGAEHGWITRAQAAERVLVTLRFLRDAPQGPNAEGMTGYRGFFYHFVDMTTGARYRDVELSTVDTTWLIAGVLFCQSYFDRDDPDEAEIRALADEIYRRVEWSWAQPRPPLVTMGWTPERGFHDLDWRGYDESMMVYILALGSPTFAIDPEAWPEFCRTYTWGSLYGYEHVTFAPLFGHQFTHAWIDFRGIRDAYMAGRGIDYAENTRRATLGQRAYAIANPRGFAGYGADVWGLTACDGAGDFTATVAGHAVTFMSYAARGVSATEVRDDGTIAPYAAASSLPFAPEVAIPALEAMHARWGDYLWTDYGFVDAFNPTLNFAHPGIRFGRLVPGVGWFNTDYLGIDQGPLVLMIENYRSGLVWQVMRRNPYVVAGLRRAGFTGGWLADAP